jgi:argininosuccinate lyase
MSSFLQRVPAMADDRSNTMWGGRFAASPDAIMEAINASIDSTAARGRGHRGVPRPCRDARRTGIVSDSDAQAIREGLLTVLSEIAAGTFPFSTALEDIHMNVEARLKGPDRRTGGAAAHRALAQRSGGDRFPAVGARAMRRRAGRAGRR